MRSLSRLVEKLAPKRDGRKPGWMGLSQERHGYRQRRKGLDGIINGKGLGVRDSYRARFGVAAMYGDLGRRWLDGSIAEVSGAALMHD